MRKKENWLMNIVLAFGITFGIVMPIFSLFGKPAVLPDGWSPSVGLQFGLICFVIVLIERVERVAEEVSSVSWLAYSIVNGLDEDTQRGINPHAIKMIRTKIGIE